MTTTSHTDLLRPLTAAEQADLDTQITADEHAKWAGQRFEQMLDQVRSAMGAAFAAELDAVAGQRVDDARLGALDRIRLVLVTADDSLVEAVAATRRVEWDAAAIGV